MIKTTWFNEWKTVLVHTFHEDWTADDFLGMVIEANTVHLSSATGPVYLLHDGRSGSRYNYLGVARIAGKIANASTHADKIVCGVFVGVPDVFNLLLDTLQRANRMSLKVRVFEELEPALHFLVQQGAVTTQEIEAYHAGAEQPYSIVSQESAAGGPEASNEVSTPLI